MSRWILRAAILFCCLAALSAAGLLLASVDVAKDKVPLVLSSLALAALAAFAILLAIGTWRKWRKAKSAAGGKSMPARTTDHPAEDRQSL